MKDGGSDVAVADEAIPTEPQIDEHGRSYATGKRKNAVARVWIKHGSGKITINGQEQEKYFARPVLRMLLQQPLGNRRARERVRHRRHRQGRRPVRSGPVLCVTASPRL